MQTTCARMRDAGRFPFVRERRRREHMPPSTTHLPHTTTPRRPTVTAASRGVVKPRRTKCVPSRREYETREITFW